ncbi:DUF1467 family protein [Thalassobaculum sp.]|jgi:predicted secreted protein|uniref:DUF1467 family protein n=1 Tax=Thalassobaculum sp. TaxID=2022740 RepID=UPI0032ED0B60
MDIVSGVVVYVLLWWLVFFVTLPIGVQTPEPSDVERGHATGAPIRPLLLKKVAAATVLAGVLWFGVYAVIASDVYSFRDAVRNW